jgi:hypothetical protein
MDYNTNHYSKYSLAICEIFNSSVHGKSDTSSKNIDSHFLVSTTLNIRDFYNSPFTFMYQIFNLMRYNYMTYTHFHNFLHPTIRNYQKILIKKKYVFFEIIECVELEGGEHVAIFKTFWLRILQRKWKRYYKLKMERLSALLDQPYGFLLREIGISRTFPTSTIARFQPKIL